MADICGWIDVAGSFASHDSPEKVELPEQVQASEEEQATTTASFEVRCARRLAAVEGTQ